MSNTKYRDDVDLEFLSKVDGNHLKILANILMEDLDGNEQWTGSLKSSLTKQSSQYQGKILYEKNWQLIASELQLYGGNTLTNVVRRQGVLYSEILCDVCATVGLKLDKSEKVIDIEKRLLLTLFQEIPNLKDVDFVLEFLKKQGYMGWSSFKSNPANFIKRDFGFGSVGVDKKRLLRSAVTMLARTSIAIPSAIWSISDVAYRITVPAVCVIAIMRQQYSTDGVIN